MRLITMPKPYAKDRAFALAGAFAISLAACTEDPTIVPSRGAELVGDASPAEPSPAERARARRLEREREAERERQAERERAAAEVDARARAEAEAIAAEEAEREAFERTYPMHGVSFHFLTPIRKERSLSAPSVGYLRRGATFRATARLEGGGCERGWHKLPGDGYVCRGEGVLIGATPQTFSPSPQPPSMEDALPYPYAYNARASTPQYVRLPRAEEESVATAFLARLVAQRAALTAQAQALSDGGVPVEAPPSGDVDAPPPPGQAPVAESTDPDAGLPPILRMEMQRGFYVSVDGTQSSEDGREFTRTVRGGFVPTAALTPNTPPTHRGVALGGSWNLPVAFVYRNGAHRLSRNAVTSELVDEGAVPQHTPFVVRERFTRGQARYLVSDDGWIVRDTAARVANLAERPSGVPEGAKWIHVDLSDQILVAYDGETPVFTTTVSTGRPGHDTPVGVFRVQSKHVSTTMDDLAAGAESFSIEDVPWTMYFQGNYALHGAFWHNQFGRVRSHGCVNLAPADARFLFGFATPVLPQSWHGVFATPRNAGTYVVVVP